MKFELVKTVEASADLLHLLGGFQVVVIRPLTHGELMAAGCTGEEAFEYFKSNVRTVVDIIDKDGRRMRLETSK